MVVVKLDVGYLVDTVKDKLKDAADKENQQRLVVNAVLEDLHGRDLGKRDIEEIAMKALEHHYALEKKKTERKGKKDPREERRRKRKDKHQRELAKIELDRLIHDYSHPWYGHAHHHAYYHHSHAVPPYYGHMYGSDSSLNSSPYSSYASRD